MSTISVHKIMAQAYAEALPIIQNQLGLPLHFLHSPNYGSWQSTSGKQVIYFCINSGDAIIGCGMAIQYKLPGGLSYLYCPYGPLLMDWDDTVKHALSQFFSAWRSKDLFVRFDSGTHPFVSPTAAAAATASLQPRNEWVLDITPPESDLFDAMHSKARYQIRVGERNNVQIAFLPTSPQILESFFALLTETSERNTFGLLPKRSYQAAFEALMDTEAYVITAEIEGELASAALIFPYNKQAHYIFGCSANKYRKIAPSYYLQWRSIIRAKELGCTSYNFGGISDDIKSTHLSGVTEFKKRFGGYSVEHGLPSDLVLQPLRYKAFNTYKRITRK